MYTFFAKIQSYTNICTIIIPEVTRELDVQYVLPSEYI